MCHRPIRKPNSVKKKKQLNTFIYKLSLSLSLSLYIYIYIYIGVTLITYIARVRQEKRNTLQKHAYLNILKISPPKTESFQIKILIFFHISAQNIDCGYSLEPPRRGGSNEYPQFMFWAEIRKIMYTPVNPSFTI